MAGFDRIKPPAQRVEERDEARVPDSDQADPKGRAALFSASGTVASRPTRSDDTAAPPVHSPDGRVRPVTSGTGPAGRRGPRRVEPGLPDERTPTRRAAAEKAAATADADGGRGTGNDTEHAARPGPRPDGAPVDADDPRLPKGRSMLQVECGHCGVQCPMPLGTAVKRAFPLAVVLPTRSHPVFAMCPCGERRTWLKPIVGRPR